LLNSTERITNPIWGERAFSGFDGRRRAQRGCFRKCLCIATSRRERQDFARTDDEYRQRGAHADNNVDFQEFMVMPVGAETFSEALRARH
jgi:hypothetical protein